MRDIKKTSKEFYKELKKEALETADEIEKSISSSDSLYGNDFGKIKKKGKKPKKNRLLAKADTAFVCNLYATAITKYQKAFSKMKGKNPQEKNRILYQIAEAYRLSGQNKKAISQYKRAIKTKYYETKPEAYYHLANLQRLAGRFPEAIEAYTLYLNLVPNDTLAQSQKESCAQTETWMQASTRYEITNLKKLNSRNNDWTPRLYDNTGSILVFTSTREGVTGKKLDEWTGERFSDLFVSSVDAKGEWSKAEILDANGKTSTPANESDASFTADGRIVYYTMCNNLKKKINRCLIYTATFDGTAWSDPTEVTIGTDTVHDYIHPYITPDGKTLYFASNKDGGYGNLDVWYSKGSGSIFSDPINMGNTINTHEKEAYPFLRNDTTFYFSSTGHSGLGGYDIFKATHTDSVWLVENMQYPINSNADDFGIVYFGDIDKGFFASNRMGGRGGDDIWSFYLPAIYYSIIGTIKNDLNMQALNDVSVSLLGSDGTLIKTLTNSKGFYKFGADQVKQDLSYQVLISKKGFLDDEATETTVGLAASKEFVRDFSMKPVPKGPVVLPDILYNLGKWDLQAQYEDSLMGLILLLEKNPRLVVELASHTDSRPIAMTNDSLSQYRAQAVVEYLILRGIHPERLIAKGYGAKVPRMLTNNITTTYNGTTYTFEKGTCFNDEFIHSLSDKNKQEAAYQLNRRTEFSVLRDDFIPSGNAASLSNQILLGDKANENKVSYELNPNKKPEIKIVVNGISFTAVIDEKGK
ncbi:MAG: OmpA family protein, partial [Bacteroidales bacterium]